MIPKKLVLGLTVALLLVHLASTGNIDKQSTSKTKNENDSLNGTNTKAPLVKKSVPHHREIKFSSGGHQGRWIPITNPRLAFRRSMDVGPEVTSNEASASSIHVTSSGAPLGVIMSSTARSETIVQLPQIVSASVGYAVAAPSGPEQASEGHRDMQSSQKSGGNYQGEVTRSHSSGDVQVQHAGSNRGYGGSTFNNDLGNSMVGNVGADSGKSGYGSSQSSFVSNAGGGGGGSGGYANFEQLPHPQNFEQNNFQSMTSEHGRPTYGSSGPTMNMEQFSGPSGSGFPEFRPMTSGYGEEHQEGGFQRGNSELSSNTLNSGGRQAENGYSVGGGGGQVQTSQNSNQGGFNYRNTQISSLTNTQQSSGSYNGGGSRIKSNSNAGFGGGYGQAPSNQESGNGYSSGTNGGSEFSTSSAVSGQYGGKSIDRPETNDGPIFRENSNFVGKQTSQQSNSFSSNSQQNLNINSVGQGYGGGSQNENAQFSGKSISAVSGGTYGESQNSGSTGANYGGSAGSSPDFIGKSVSSGSSVEAPAFSGKSKMNQGYGNTPIENAGPIQVPVFIGKSMSSGGQGSGPAQEQAFIQPSFSGKSVSNTEQGFSDGSKQDSSFPGKSVSGGGQQYGGGPSQGLSFSGNLASAGGQGYSSDGPSQSVSFSGKSISNTEQGYTGGSSQGPSFSGKSISSGNQGYGSGSGASQVASFSGKSVSGGGQQYSGGPSQGNSFTGNLGSSEEQGYSGGGPKQSISFSGKSIPQIEQGYSGSLNQGPSFSGKSVSSGSQGALFSGKSISSGSQGYSSNSNQGTAFTGKSVSNEGQGYGGGSNQGPAPTGKSISNEGQRYNNEPIQGPAFTGKSISSPGQGYGAAPIQSPSLPGKSISNLGQGNSAGGNNDYGQIQNGGAQGFESGGSSFVSGGYSEGSSGGFSSGVAFSENHSSGGSYGGGSGESFSSGGGQEHAMGGAVFTENSNTGGGYVNSGSSSEGYGGAAFAGDFNSEGVHSSMIAGGPVSTGVIGNFNVNGGYGINNQASEQFSGNSGYRGSSFQSGQSGSFPGQINEGIIGGTGSGFNSGNGQKSVGGGYGGNSNFAIITQGPLANTKNSMGPITSGILYSTVNDDSGFHQQSGGSYGVGNQAQHIMESLPPVLILGGHNQNSGNNFGYGISEGNNQGGYGENTNSVSSQQIPTQFTGKSIHSGSSAMSGGNAVMMQKDYSARLDSVASIGNALYRQNVPETLNSFKNFNINNGGNYMSERIVTLYPTNPTHSDSKNTVESRFGQSIASTNFRIPKPNGHTTFRPGTIYSRLFTPAPK